MQRGVSASSSPEYSDSSISDALNTVTSAARDSIAKAVTDVPDLDEEEVALKKKRVENRMKTYTVNLPLASSVLEERSKLLSIGISLCQIKKGRVFERPYLNLDTLELEEMTSSQNLEEVEFMDEQGLARRIDGEFQGIVVASVIQGSAAWTAGVRAGDILQATSATMGSKLWPKSTLEGVRSAIQSRKAASKSMEIVFQLLGDAVDNQFELTLTKPIGIQLRETTDGYVEVSGFTENAPTLVRYAVRVGDRVLAVDSSLGEKLWPVSTVEGVISSVTSRLPGQQITFRFERPIQNFEETSEVQVVSSVAVDEAVVEVATPQVEERELLKRCREVIKRYTADAQEKNNFVNKYAVPGLVADKVLDSLASSGTRVDRITLSMIMAAYLSCRQSEKAIQVFEAITGLRADGSTSEAQAFIEGSSGKRIVASEDALDVYTVSALLKAHAMAGDLSSVKRVLAAVEGRGGSEEGGLKVATWPGTGVDGSLKPDTRCYNIAISAAANSSARDGLELALNIFNAMSNPNQQDCEKQKNLVSYNIVMNALTNRGRYQDVVELFYEMKRLGMKPDKLSYTSLVKAVASDGDIEGNIEELFYDMTEEGVAADVVTYNTAIKTLCEQRKITAAKKIVSFMERSGVSPDSMTYGLLMKGLVETRNPAACLTLFETACADSRTVVFTENEYLYTTAISAAASLGDHERAFELLSRMNSIGVKPNLKTMTAVMGACLSGGKPELAADIYQRIPNPDGYAIQQGLQAMSESGNTEEALAILAQKSGKKRNLTGKQTMRAYKNMIETSIKSGDFDMARKVVTTLIGQGNIPSKAIFLSSYEAMKIFPKKQKGLGTPIMDVGEDATEKFKFLLFLLDSVASRKLPCEGHLYSAILTYGYRIGGLPKKMASLLVSAKTELPTGEKLIDDEDCERDSCLFMAWEDLFLEYDDLKERIATDGLPRLVVRSGGRDIPLMLKAEMNLSYRRSKLV